MAVDFWAGLNSGLSFSFRSSPTPFSKEKEVICDAPSYFMPIRDEFDPTDELR